LVAIIEKARAFQKWHSILIKIYHTKGFMLPKALNCQHKHAFILVKFKNAIILVVIVEKASSFQRRHSILIKITYTNGYMLQKA